MAIKIPTTTIKDAITAKFASVTPATPTLDLRAYDKFANQELGGTELLYDSVGELPESTPTSIGSTYTTLNPSSTNEFKGKGFHIDLGGSQYVNVIPSDQPTANWKVPGENNAWAFSGITRVSTPWSNNIRNVKEYWPFANDTNISAPGIVATSMKQIGSARTDTMIIAAGDYIGFRGPPVGIPARPFITGYRYANGSETYWNMADYTFYSQTTNENYENVYFSGGKTTSTSAFQSGILKAQKSNAVLYTTPVGALTEAREQGAPGSSSVNAYIFGGITQSPGASVQSVDKFPFATDVSVSLGNVLTRTSPPGLVLSYVSMQSDINAYLSVAYNSTSRAGALGAKFPFANETQVVVAGASWGRYDKGMSSGVTHGYASGGNFPNQPDGVCAFREKMTWSNENSSIPTTDLTVAGRIGFGAQT